MMRLHFINHTSMTLALILALSPLHAEDATAPPDAVPAADADPGLDDLPVKDPTERPAAPSGELLPPGCQAAPSQNAMVNLLNILVAKGNLTRQEGNALIQQAEHDAELARAQAAAAAADPVDDNDLQVTYIPEMVRDRIRDEIKDEVLAAARNEKWALASAVPEWTERFKPIGDIRLRYESLMYDSGNDNTGAFPNFNAINTGAPFDISGNVFSPQYNVDTDRARMRLRARFGAEMDLGENWTGGLRIATGENNTPVTTNQSLGLANQGQGGNFSKYAIWLDRAFFKVDIGNGSNRNLALYFGRFDNPFFCSEIIFDEDVGFDGLALKGRYELVDGFTPFLTASASPVFNTDLNFSSNQPAKFQSTDKWLYAIQAGFELALTKKIDLKLGAGYFNFQGVEGKLSDPYTPLTASDAGNTDNTRPSFAQKGNTYTPLRNIIPSALNNFGTTQQFQYFGLATPFQVLTLTGQLDFNQWEPCQITLKAEYAKNLAFRQGDIES
ncbi:MAG: putative porin, partial [Verrucomicrobiaceae bacterium]